MALPDSTSPQVIRSHRNRKRNAANPSADRGPALELALNARDAAYASLPGHGLSLDGAATLRQVDPKDYLGYFSTR